MNEYHILFIKRLKLLVISVCLVIAAITCYLFYLQVTLKVNFFHKGRQNFLRNEIVLSPRGNIIDSEGNLLATNRPITSIYWQSTGSTFLTAQQKYAIKQLQEINNFADTIEEEILSCEKRGLNKCLIYDASFQQLSKIIEQCNYCTNITIHKGFKRYYPYKTIACHLIGYLTNLGHEPQGTMGLELLFDTALKGRPGQRVKTINSIGRYLESKEIKRALTGDTIQTTLSLKLQTLAEEVFPQDQAGVFLVLDPDNGAIKALVSRPNFDPNIFLTKINTQQWHVLQEKKCFINRAFNACYPPASLFKLITLSAALETNIIDYESSWRCTGHTLFAGRAYHCARAQGHGILKTQESLARSCNIPFFDIAKKIKIDTLADYAQRLGLGLKTTVLLSEKPGLVPTSYWKKTIKGEPWWSGDTLSAVIGQSYILITPIQAACMISAFCNGGYLVRPRVLLSEAITKQPINLQPETIQFIKECMKQVISQGNAKNLAKLSDFTIYGKTGTAQTSDLSKRELGIQFIEHAWFAAYFYYKNHKPLTLVVLIENAGSSQSAIAVADAFFKRYETSSY
jgi:penicillin-binding protein 2